MLWGENFEQMDFMLTQLVGQYANEEVIRAYVKN